LRAQRQAAVDAYDVQRADYRQTVLAALVQVADTLKALEFDAQALHAQDAARSAASEALGLLQANYHAGLVAYVDVLAADVQYHQAVIGDLQAVALRQQDTVALFVALGGGWWSAPSFGGVASAP
jgi:outer membrane protein TolC